MVKWIKSSWAAVNIHPKMCTSCSYNRQPVVQTKNTLPQLVMEKVTHQTQMGKSLLIPEAFTKLDLLQAILVRKWLNHRWKRVMYGLIAGEQPFVPSCQDVSWLTTHKITSQGEWVLLDIAIPLLELGSIIKDKLQTHKKYLWDLLLL